MKKGLVTKSTGSWYTVKAEDNDIYQCRIRGKFRIKGIKSTNPIAVGDLVDFSVEEDGDGVISKIYERKNYIIRRSSNLSKQSHIIASNIDRAFLIVTLAHPVTSTAFIDRFLVTAEAYKIPVNIVFNKIDLYNESGNEYLDELIDIYEKVGYKCHKVSAIKEINIDLLKDLMKGNINVVSGHSGVGKSTLINAIDPQHDLKTGEISESHFKGKHTTTFAEMVELAEGGYIIDTPGIKGFGIIDMEKEEISHYFPEIFKISDECQFNNCMHTHEPGCAVKSAVEDGIISEIRYYNYLSLLEGDDEKHRQDKYQ